ncbi:hypothetical protein Asppvi_009317 [Aspergillus pseudoviridinutans]|uniref:Uncharacterized protein n=1 Tax=Aspergillus pseudoviridinutans TaxID=1517512 RepID=A0A9P3BL72_9EURO|nr:uncharacterized protein Asppvi_009317 [Aspergillus pseudoviridinutans]GIJ90363.1 hypothetical protein Asppvi_009317 [Aspergillus pseudoviridinutans]
MAFGFQALAARSQPSAGSDVSRKAIARLRMALSPHDAVQRSPDTLLKMQIRTPDWTDYALPKVGKDTDWLLIQCQHANTLSSAVNTLYSSRALCQTVAERERNLMQAHMVLESWRTGLPIHLQNIHRHETGYVTLDDQKTRHLTLTMVRKYHEAIFIIFFPWTGSQSRLISEHYRKRRNQPKPC